MSTSKNLISFITQKIVEIYLALTAVAAGLALLNIAAYYLVQSERMLELLMSRIFLPSYATLVLLVGITMIAEVVTNQKKEQAWKENPVLSNAAHAIIKIMDSSDYDAMVRYISARFLVDFYDLADYLSLKYQHDHKKPNGTISYYAKRISLATNNRHLLFTCDSLYELLGTEGCERFLRFITTTTEG